MRRYIKARLGNKEMPPHVFNTGHDAFYGVTGFHRDQSVIIPGESILFVRPRVDAVATADSVHEGKGTIGKLTDSFPWVDSDVGLTPLAYAYALPMHSTPHALPLLALPYALPLAPSRYALNPQPLAPA